MARTNIEKNVVKHHGRWYLRKMLYGRAYNIELHAANKDHALARARKEWKRIRTGTWSKEAPNTARGSKRVPSIGELEKPYANAAIKPAQGKRVDNYRCLRRIVREVFGVPDKEARAMSTAKAITPDVLSQWITQREARPPCLTKSELAAREEPLSKSGKLTPVDLNRVRTTIVAQAGNARAVFSQQCRDPKHGYLRPFNIPELEGFLTLPLPTVIKTVYKVPSETMIDRIVAALPALEARSPAIFIGILLGLGMGLRRGEIQHARWTQIFWENKTPMLVLGATHDWHGTKGKEERKIPIPAAVYQALIKHQDQGTYLVPDKRDTPEVIKSGNGHYSTQRPGRGKTGPNAYRKSTSGTWGMAADCNRWLTSVGWNRRQKLHEMRKYFGAMVVTETGSLYEAQQVLGHQCVETTRDAYAGLTKRTKYTEAVDKRLLCMS